MAENFANNYVVKLGADMTSSATSMTVNSTAGAPSPNFRVLVDEELMLVTAVVDSTTFTVTRGIEGTTAAAHTAAVAGDTINLVRFPTSGSATLSAISIYDANYAADKAADGLITTGNGWAKAGWAVNDWWKCTWSVPQDINRIRLYGRTTGEPFGSGYIEFSDAVGDTSITFSNVTSASTPRTIDFDPRLGIDWFRVVSTSGGSGNTGLAEVEAYLTERDVVHVLTAGSIAQAISDAIAAHIAALH